MQPLHIAVERLFTVNGSGLIKYPFESVLIVFGASNFIEVESYILNLHLLYLVVICEMYELVKQVEDRVTWESVLMAVYVKKRQADKLVLNLSKRQLIEEAC